MDDTTLDDTTPTQPRVEHCVDVDASPDDVWHTLTDPAELARWLDAEVVLELEPGAVGRVTDADGTVREVLVTQVEPGRVLAWHWWEDGGELSSVEITTLPIDDGTRVRIVECLATPAAPRGTSAQASAGRPGPLGPLDQRWQHSLVILAADVGAGAGRLVAARR